MSFHVPPSPYATFLSTQTQTIANAANAQAITFNAAGTSKGITLVSSTRITLPQTGNYALSFSAIGHNFGSSNPKWFNIYLRKNGSDLANSSTIVAVIKDNPVTVAATFDVACNVAGDYYEIFMAGEDANCQILATPAQAAVPSVSPAMPACPSIIVAVWQVN